MKRSASTTSFASQASQAPQGMLQRIGELGEELQRLLNDAPTQIAAERAALAAERDSWSPSVERQRQLTKLTGTRSDISSQRAAVARARVDFEAEKTALKRHCAAFAAAADAQSSESIVTLSVGGQRVCISRATLCQVEGSMFSVMFGGRWDETLQRDAHGDILLSHDPDLVLLVLDYLCLRRLVPKSAKLPRPKVAAARMAAFDGLLDYLGLAEIFVPAKETFDTGPRYSISADGTQATHRPEEGGWAIVAGTIGVSVGTHAWRLRFRGYHAAMVGVTPVSTLTAIRTNRLPHTTAGFHLHLATGTLFSGAPLFYHRAPYCTVNGAAQPLAENTVVTVKVDCHRGTVSFALDDVDMGVAFTHIPCATEPVVLVVSLDEGMCVTLLDFQ